MTGVFVYVCVCVCCFQVVKHGRNIAELSCPQVSEFRCYGTVMCPTITEDTGVAMVVTVCGCWFEVFEAVCGQRFFTITTIFTSFQQGCNAISGVFE